MPVEESNPCNAGQSRVHKPLCQPAICNKPPKLAESRGFEPLRDAMPGYGLAIRPIPTLATFRKTGRPGGNRTHIFRLKRPLQDPFFATGPKNLVGVGRFELPATRLPDEDSNQTELHPDKTRQTISGILLSTIIRLALTLPPESLPGTRWLVAQSSPPASGCCTCAVARFTQT